MTVMPSRNSPTPPRMAIPVNILEPVGFIAASTHADNPRTVPTFATSVTLALLHRREIRSAPREGALLLAVAAERLRADRVRPPPHRSDHYPGHPVDPPVAVLPARVRQRGPAQSAWRGGDDCGGPGKNSVVPPGPAQDAPAVRVARVHGRRRHRRNRY